MTSDWVDIQSVEPTYIAGAVLTVLVLAVFLSLSLRKRKHLRRASRPETGPPFQYVHVDDDGTVRELEPFEIEYLNTEFHGADGGRPYIKGKYPDLTPDGRIWGFLARSKVPPGMRIKPALEGVSPVTTAEEAIAVARTVIAKSVTHVAIDPGNLGTFSAELAGGIWRVSRVPPASEGPTPPPHITRLYTVVGLSSASGRVVSYGWG